MKCSRGKRVLKAHGPYGVRICDGCDDWRGRYLNAEIAGMGRLSKVAPTLFGAFYDHRFIRWPPLSPTSPDAAEGMVCLSGEEHMSSALSFVFGIKSFDLYLPIPNLRAPFWTLFLGNSLVGQGRFECHGDATKQGAIWIGKNFSILANAKQKSKEKNKSPNVAFICHANILALHTTSLTLQVFHQPTQFGKIDKAVLLGIAEIPLLRLASHISGDVDTDQNSHPEAKRYGQRLVAGNLRRRQKLPGSRWGNKSRFHAGDIVQSCCSVALPVFFPSSTRKMSSNKANAHRSSISLSKKIGKTEPKAPVGTAHLSFDVGTPQSLRDGNGKDIINTMEQFCHLLTPAMRKTVMAPKPMRQGLNQYFRICYLEAQNEAAELQDSLDLIDRGQPEDGEASAVRSLVLDSDDLVADLHRCSERFNRLMWICDAKEDDSLLSLHTLEYLGQGGEEGLFACQVRPSSILSASTTSLLPPVWKKMFQKEIQFLHNMLALDVVWGKVIHAVRDNADLRELEQNETDISKRLQLHLHSDQVRGGICVFVCCCCCCCYD